MGYPTNDLDFQEFVIASLVEISEGWRISSASGNNEFVPKGQQSKPQINEIFRVYGHDTFRRGLFVGERQVFYRTRDENIKNIRSVCLPQSRRFNDRFELN